LDEGTLSTFDSTFKVHPPLRSRSDVEGLRAALLRGDVDAVATDHAPHAPELKDLPFDEAPPGMLGLEHAAALTFEALGEDAADPVLFFSLMSRAPARIARLRASDPRVALGAHGGSMSEGEDANVVVFDPKQRWTASRDALQSRAMNTPYDGRAMSGRVRTLVANGALVVDEGSLS